MKSEEILTQQYQEFITDKYIFDLLLEQLLSGEVGYVDFWALVDDDKLQELQITRDFLCTRLFWNIGGDCIDLQEVKSEKIDKKQLEQDCERLGIDFHTICINDKLDMKNYYKNFMKIKINPKGIERIQTIKDELKTISKKLKYYWLYNIKYYLEKLYKSKTYMVIGITVILVFMITVFNVKVSHFIEKMPFLGSIIDTDFLEKFEEVDTSDEEYQYLEQTLASDIKEKVNNPTKDVRVNKLNENESVFQINLDDGTKKYFLVEKQEQDDLSKQEISQQEAKQIIQTKNLDNLQQRQRLPDNQNLREIRNHEYDPDPNPYENQDIR